MKYLNSLAHLCFQQSALKGFWDVERNKGEMIALMHSELSELLEATREEEPPPSEKIEGFSLEEEECADIIIRVLDYCGGFNLDVASAVEAKLQYNKNRPHKHGKVF